MQDWFPLITICLAIAYLLTGAVPVLMWMIRGIWRWMGRKHALTRLQGLQSGKKFQKKNLVLPVVGVLVGVLLGGWVRTFSDVTWWLFWITLIGWVMEELREPRRLATLPAALQILDVFAAAQRRGQDAYGALLAAAEELLPGDAFQVVEQALDRQLMHLPPEKVFLPLANFHPVLQELTLTLQDHGWQVTDRFTECVNKIYQRSQTEIVKTTARRLMYSQASTWAQISKAMLSGMILTVLLMRTAWVPLMEHGQVWIFVMLLSVVALMLLLIQRYHLSWPRRLIVIASVAMVITVLWGNNSPRVASSAAAVVPSSTPKVIATSTRVAPLMKDIATATPSSSLAVQPSITPRPMIKKEISPVQVGAGDQIRKKPQLYPLIWMSQKP